MAKTSLNFEIHTQDRRLGHTMFGFRQEEGITSLKTGAKREVAQDIEAVFQHVESRRSLDWPEIVAFVVTVSASIPPEVAANLITQWLMSMIPRKPEKIVVERTEIEFEEGLIRRIIHEKMSQSR